MEDRNVQNEIDERREQRMTTDAKIEKLEEKTEALKEQIKSIKLDDEK